MDMFSPPKIVILMSTWNGEKYLEQQLQSIYEQNCDNIEIIIRDDGSADKTVDILRKHQSEDRVKLICGENIGFVGSFLKLINTAPKADYYFFADQDDIWLDFKVKRAVEKMSLGDYESSLPLLYFSNYDFYDEAMNFVRNNIFPSKVNLPMAVSEPIAAGFTCAFNYSLLKIMRRFSSHCVCSHDRLALILATAGGTVIMDDFVTAKYRRHGSVASPSGKSWVKQLLWRLNFVRKNCIKPEFNQIMEIAGSFARPENVKLLKLFARRGSFCNVRLFFFNHRFRTHLIDEISIRVLFLLNVI